MRFAERVIGGIAGLLSLICFIDSHRLWGGWHGAGSLLLFLGIIFTFLAVVFLVFPSRNTSSLQLLSKEEWISIGVIGGSFAIYITIMNWMGYLISTWLFLSVVERYLSHSRITSILIWTGAMAVGTYVIFKIYLGAYLPVGLLGI